MPEVEEAQLKAEREGGILGREKSGPEQAKKGCWRGNSQEVDLR